MFVFFSIGLKKFRYIFQLSSLDSDGQVDENQEFFRKYFQDFQRYFSSSIVNSLIHPEFWNRFRVCDLGNYLLIVLS